MTCDRHESHGAAESAERAGQAEPGANHVTTARYKWSKEQIQQARKTPLPPILQDRGYALRPLSDGNYELEETKGLVVKRHYWIWNNTGMKGNAIDFFIQIECRSFNQAMQILLGPQ